MYFGNPLTLLALQVAAISAKNNVIASLWHS